MLFIIQIIKINDYIYIYIYIYSLETRKIFFVISMDLNISTLNIYTLVNNCLNMDPSKEAKDCKI